MDLRNHSIAMDARIASASDLASQDDLTTTEDSDVGVLHPPKGWKDVPKVRAIMVSFTCAFNVSYTSP